MSFDRTGYYAIGHARPLRPNQRMDHFYILTAIDRRASWDHVKLREDSCNPMVRPMSYILEEWRTRSWFPDTFDLAGGERRCTVRIKWQLFAALRSAS